MKDFTLEIEYIGGYVYIKATCNTMYVCYDASTPEEIANAVQRYIEEDI